MTVLLALVSVGWIVLLGFHMRDYLTTRKDTHRGRSSTLPFPYIALVYINIVLPGGLLAYAIVTTFANGI